MYDMTKIVSKTWNIIFADGERLSILPPKIKDKNKLHEYSSNTENYLDNLMKCAYFIINNNKEKKVYTEEQLAELLDEDMVTDFVINYTHWIYEITDEKN